MWSISASKEAFCHYINAVLRNVVIVNIEAVAYFQKLGNKMCVVESYILQARIYA